MLVATSDGLTVGQPTSDTLALVEAPGVSGVPVGGWPGVRTDFRGYTTLGYLTPYQKNEVSLDPTLLPDDAAVTQTSVTVVPTQGAVVKAAFRTSVGTYRAAPPPAESPANPAPAAAPAARPATVPVSHAPPWSAAHAR